MSVENRATRLSLTVAQRRAIDNDDIAWLGWDARQLPVLRDEHGQYALAKSGEPVGVTEPVEWAQP